MDDYDLKIRNLWRASILQVLQDAASFKLHKAERAAKKDALKWLKDDDNIYYICQLADIDFRRIFKQRDKILEKELRMQTLTGQQFKNMVLGSGLKMCQILKESKVSSATFHKWLKNESDIYLNGTYNKLIAAYEKLKAKKDSNA